MAHAILIICGLFFTLFILAGLKSTKIESPGSFTLVAWDKWGIIYYNLLSDDHKLGVNPVKPVNP